MNKELLGNEILFAKVKEGAIIPTKREEDGCYDLYVCFEEEEITISPREIKLIPTGIMSAFDKKYRIGFRERGSNTKSKLIIVSGQIDSGFKGEWFIAVYNTQDYPIVISKLTDTYEPLLERRFKYMDDYEATMEQIGVKIPYCKAICQFAIEEVPSVYIKETTKEEVESYISERGEGMMGSSGK